ncbi:unnamed protein product, partial [marine sediment metagenome]
MWIVIAATQAEQAQRALREEEEMTQYSDSDIAGDWEFKIVRAVTGAFRKPEEFAKLLEGEARFGWKLLEKLDDSRVRFKRHVKERVRDRNAGPSEDPYRSIYGRSPGKQAGLIIL